MKIKTSAPSVLDLILRILSSETITVNKISNNEASISGPQESDIRLLLQKRLDDEKFNFEDDFILVDGNTIWSHKRIIKEIEKIRKSNNTEGISKYFYNFMHLNFTTTHFDIHGWKQSFRDYGAVVAVINQNTVPEWKTDVIKIIKSIKKK